MNKASTHLFDLIKQLTKSEKRYFKIYVSRHAKIEDNKSWLLFEFLDQLEQYDESLVLRHFKKESFINQFSTTKNRLYQTILDSLTLFYANQSVDAEIAKQIQSADILFNKGLYQQAYKLTQSAEKLALKHERYESILQIKSIEKKLIEKEAYALQQNDQLQSLEKMENKCIHQIQEMQLLWSVKSKLFQSINQKGQIRSGEDKEEIQNIISPILFGFSPSPSVKNQYLYNHIMSAYFYHLHQSDKSYEYLTKNLNLVESNAKLFESEPNVKFSILSNLVYITTQLNEYLQANTYLSQLKQLNNQKEVKQSLDLQIKYFSTINSLELSLRLVKSDFHHLDQLIEKIHLGLNQYSHLITPIRKTDLEFKMAVLLLKNGQYKQALKPINDILNSNQSNQSTLQWAMLLSLVTHYELNNFDYLPYAIQSIKRQFSKQSTDLMYEQMFVKMFEKIAKPQLDPFEIKELIEPHWQAFQDLKEHSFHWVDNEYFDFESWMYSKKEGQSILNIKHAG